MSRTPQRSVEAWLLFFSMLRRRRWVGRPPGARNGDSSTDPICTLALGADENDPSARQSRCRKPLRRELYFLIVTVPGVICLSRQLAHVGKERRRLANEKSHIR